MIQQPARRTTRWWRYAFATLALAIIMTGCTSSTSTTTSEIPTTTKPPPSTTTKPPPSTTTLPRAKGLFSAWVGGGDPGPCDDIFFDVPPQPPSLAIGYGNVREALGGVVVFCILGFSDSSPITATVEHPDSSETEFTILIDTDYGDILDDPLRGETVTGWGGMFRFVLRSSYAPGKYVFTATQGEVVATSVLEMERGSRPYVEVLDRVAPVGSTIRFAVSGVDPGAIIPLAVYRNTGVLDRGRDDCDSCFFYELFIDGITYRADDNGGRLLSLPIDESYLPPSTPPKKDNPEPIGGPSFCVVTPLSQPSCDPYYGGWFRVNDAPKG
jgi:hypothetical protein